MPIQNKAQGLKLSLCGCLILLVCYAVSAADSASMLSAKNKIRELDNQISQLRQTLSNAHDKRGLLNKELAETERKIGTGIKKLRSIQNDMRVRQQKINALEQSVTELNSQLRTQQDLLARHIRVRYKMGEYQSLKWIINQDDPHSLSRLLTFHQYLVRSRQQAIDDIARTKVQLTQSQRDLKKDIAEQQIMAEQLAASQQLLEKNKEYHTAVIQSLNNDIQSREHSLSEAQRNKENLARLLKSLAQASEIKQVKQPFVQMHHKLPKPIREAGSSMEKTGQGLTFFAGEGTPVHAVYPGKIVFSDWLNGYGLLIIIDHGQGFMTLYARNQSLYRHKGSMVMQGEQIAAVGHSGGIQKNGLYFEVRQRGKAVPPLDWIS
ncbi:murein hydrolase activator EnvC family protein [Legionella sp. CNM-4043-24]|uniref:murein hydrolase activator EnvC family protein n=1 Tax=Legionella sp. CNM-4043-24 TaxID=3421646 RepID=UPI00403AE9B6